MQAALKRLSLRKEALRVNDRARLRAYRDTARATVLDWIRRARRFQRWITIAGVIAGPALLGVGSGLSGELRPAGGDGLTWKGLVLFGGALLAVVGGILNLLIQETTIEALERAETLEGEAQAFLDERDRMTSESARRDALDTRRLALIEMGRAVVEACENALLAEELSLSEAINTVLRAGQRDMLAAIDFSPHEYWAVSVFRVEAEELRRVVALRPDPLDEQVDGRSWKRGEGFAGTAWLRDAEVVVADCNAAEIADAFVVPPDKRIVTDGERYRSMAVVPIRVGPADDFWGAVAVSSDCIGRFRRAPRDDRTKNLDTVRLLARAVELLAAGFSRGNQ